jgi:hypothetical protein
MPHGRQHRFRPQFTIPCLIAAAARYCALVRHRKTQQLGQGRGAGLMHGRTHQHLDGFQIHAAALV